MGNTHAGLHFEDFPGLEDFPHFSLDVASPEIPCGSSWLGNCFLELGIPLWKPWGLDTQREWQRIGPFHYRYVQGPSPLQQTLPALVTDREFAFRAQPVPRFTHRWPFAFSDRNKVIFFVRDPRDALYSEWRRQQANGRLPKSMGFVEFVGSRYYHYSFSYRNYLLLFLRLWREALVEQEYLIIRFEDYKANASATLQRVIDFLGIKVTASEIKRATKLSDFSVAKKVEQERLAKNELLVELNRAGIPFEYADSYTPVMHDSIGSLFDPFYEWLGYESYEEGRRRSYPSQLQESEVDRLLAAMDAFSGPEAQWRRLAELVRLHAADLFLKRAE